MIFCIRCYSMLCFETWNSTLGKMQFFPTKTSCSKAEKIYIISSVYSDVCFLILTLTRVSCWTFLLSSLSHFLYIEHIKFAPDMATTFPHLTRRKKEDCSFVAFKVKHWLCFQQRIKWTKMEMFPCFGVFIQEKGNKRWK